VNALGAIGLTLLYLLPVSLLALLLTHRVSGYPRWLITVVLLALPAFYVGHYHLLEQMQGWPSDAPLPQRFRLLGFDVTEPDTGKGETGRVLLWVQAPDSVSPRAHRLPYSKDLHQELVAAGQRRKNSGRTQIGTHQRATPGATDRPASEPQERIRFEDAKGPRLPAK